MSAHDLAAAGGSTTPAPERTGISLSELTTLRVGGPARRLIEASSEEQVIGAVARAEDAGQEVLVLGGGSNLVVADQGFEGTVVQMATRGVSLGIEGATGQPVLVAAAGEPWDEVVSGAAEAGLSGIEALSGIPGSAGATPIQNVGAYGQQVSDTILSVRAYDRRAREVIELAGTECGFSYRSSVFRATDRYVVLRVVFALERSDRGRPIRYPELARALGVAPGARPPLREVRDAVLTLRRGKGMVIDPRDPDSVSAGSFFTNPILSAEAFAELGRRAAERLGAESPPPGWPEGDGQIKTSAAWLIERAGVRRGYGTGPAGISSKHTLAIVNRGGARTADVLAVAREVRDRVQATFGVTLRPEPTLIGTSL